MAQAKPTVLLITHNRSIQLVIEYFLRKVNCNLDTVSSPLQGISAIEQKNYQFILLDMQHPYLNEQIGPKSLGENFPAHIPLIGLTLETPSIVLRKYKKAGIDEYLMKPLTEEKIHALLKKHLNMLPSFYGRDERFTILH